MDARQNAIFIVTGLSGAGKSQVIRCFEDLGFLCVDNLIPALLPQFIELTYPRMGQIAIVIDLRGGAFFQELPPVLDRLRKEGYPARVVFLEASDEVLLHRFSETRRRHPLWGQSTLESSIRDEREQLAEIRALADVILDTTELSTRQLKEKLISSFIQTDQAAQSMQVTVKSFGFKFGPPMDADLVLDVRFLPNPHYIAELKPFTGLHEPVADFVLSHPVTLEFLERFLDLASFLLPHYSKEGKTHLAIAIGCTGGRHRSVAIAHQLALWFRRDGYAVVEEHRDIDKQNDLYTRDAVRGPA